MPPFVSHRITRSAPASTAFLMVCKRILRIRLIPVKEMFRIVKHPAIFRAKIGHGVGDEFEIFGE